MIILAMYRCKDNGEYTILGPLIGADLLRLKQIIALSSGNASIGGAGTFDGIVISGFIALLLS